MPTGHYVKTEEHRRNLAIVMRERGKYFPGPEIGWHHSVETKKKISKAHQGTKMSEATKQKISEANKGRKMTAEQIERRRKAHPSYRHGWIADKIFRGVRVMYEYEGWRSDVLERDGWKCQTCGLFGIAVLHAHHLIEMSDIVYEHNVRCLVTARSCVALWDRSNGITLCPKCHVLAHKSRVTREERKLKSDIIEMLDEKLKLVGDSPTPSSSGNRT